MAINNKPASAYAKPHTMSGGKISLKQSGYEGGDRYSVECLKPSIGGIAGKPYAEPKTDGITMRGYGAATKGIKSRGPMA